MSAILSVVLLIGWMAPLKAATVEDIANRSKCDIGDIAYYVGQALQYPRWDNHPPVFEDAQVCLTRGVGDCKCHATVAMEVMGYCGYKALLVTVEDRYQSHALVLFKDKKGNRGYLDVPNYRFFDGDTPWKEIVSRIPGWHWEVRE